MDIGGGTGNFTQKLACAAGISRDVLCVDNSLEMLELASAREGVATCLNDAVAFSQRSDCSYDLCLLKEVVHHVQTSNLTSMYAGIHSQLSPGGIVLTITRPQDVDYPLFAAAREVWRRGQPPVELFVSALKDAGFSQVHVAEHTYTATLPRARWLRMAGLHFRPLSSLTRHDRPLLQTA